MEAVLAQVSLPATMSGLVVVGRDTRVSSPHLCSLVASGVAAVGGRVHDLGVVTTPQVHWVVLRANQQVPAAVPSLSGYYEEHVSALKTLLVASDGTHININVDCANGVGAKSLFEMQAVLKIHKVPMNLTAFNTGGLESGSAAPDPTFLNSGCGAEFVQKTKAGSNSQKSALVILHRKDSRALPF